MFNCKMCTESPLTTLGQLFGTLPDPKENSKMGGNKKKETPKGGAGGASRKPAGPQRSVDAFQARSEEELAATVKTWETYVHPRAREFFQEQNMLVEVLTQLAKGVDRSTDPILGPEDDCVWWYGDTTKDDDQAAIRMVKPGETQESVTYVNRVLAFLFATDDSFEKLMQLPKEPFKMCCGSQLCVHLSHIGLSV